MSITFLIPIYNEVKTVKKAVDETLKIDLPNKEIIIIDNNSNDGSKNIIEEYKNIRNVKIIFQSKNYGFGKSIQDGVKNSSNEFIYIQYGDLEYDINKCFEMLSIMKKNNLDTVFASRLKNINSLQEMFNKIIKKPSYLATIFCTFLINWFYKKNFTDIIGTKLYRRKTIQPIIPKVSGQGFDFELVSLICKKNLKVEEVFIDYTPRINSREKNKILPYF